MVVKSVIQRLKNKFNISVGEVGETGHTPDYSNRYYRSMWNTAQVDSTIENVIKFVEGITDAEIIKIESEEEDF